MRPQLKTVEAPWSPDVYRTPRRASIGVVRDILGVTSRAIRHYEQLGLIDCERDPRGTRHLSDTALERLAVIRDLRMADVSVPRIGEILLGGEDLATAVRAELRVQARKLEAQQARLLGLMAGYEVEHQGPLVPAGQSHA
jgi:DNA-binding transcriptional MerR regulator